MTGRKVRAPDESSPVRVPAAPGAEPGHTANAGNAGHVVDLSGRLAAAERRAEEARRDALLEAAALCDRMADDAIEEAGAFDPPPETRDEDARADTRRVALEGAASQLVAARDRLRAMAGEAPADDPHAALVAAARWVASRLDDKAQPHLKGRLLDAITKAEGRS